jgi:hypothetical protein
LSFPPYVLPACHAHSSSSISSCHKYLLKSTSYRDVYVLLPAVVTSFLGPNILFSSPFRNINSCSSSATRHRASHTYKTTSVLYCNLNIFRYQTGRQKS